MGSIRVLEIDSGIALHPASAIAVGDRNNSISTGPGHQPVNPDRSGLGHFEANLPRVRAAIALCVFSTEDVPVLSTPVQ